MGAMYSAQNYLENRADVVKFHDFYMENAPSTVAIGAIVCCISHKLITDCCLRALCVVAVVRRFSRSRITSP